MASTMPQAASEILKRLRKTWSLFQRRSLSPELVPLYPPWQANEPGAAACRDPGFEDSTAT